ncbi:MAG TPA: paraquat-inducible protein A [Terriglobia bacterium]|nr:paraquat-inducible protein A [Terriglobia bacterium]
MASLKSLRLAVCILLLAASAALTYPLDIAMHATRDVRIDQAEVRHIRYDLLNANVWADRIAPIFSKKIEAFDLTAADRAALRPTVSKMVERMIFQAGHLMGKQIAANKTFGLFGAQISGFLTSSLLTPENVKAYVPQLTDTILAEMGKPELKQAIQQSLKKNFAANATAAIDMSKYDAVLQKYGCSSRDDCRMRLTQTIDDADSRIYRYAGAVVAMAALAFGLMLIRKTPLSRSETVVLGLFCAVLLWAGLRNPMIDIDARISRLSFTLSGEPIEFTDQGLFFQSKSIIDVVRLLIETHKPGMVTVGLMVLAFSVVFPISKLIATALYRFRVRGLQENGLVRFFALKSSKWSMADVLVVAMFMAYIGFDGVISTELGQLQEAASGMTVLTTNNTSLRAGFYLFLSFCIGGMLLAWALERAPQSVEQDVPPAAGT